MTFHVGQKVECISFPPHDADVPKGLEWPAHIKIGGRYTVRDYWCDPRCPSYRLLWLNEHVAAPFGRHEPGFLAEHFRPIVEKKTDISVFTALLNPSPAKETERV